MPRGRDEVRQRLQGAALELYRERGYDQTTTAEIAAHAGVTERTFFRHFPDKREVLFEGEAVLRAALTDAIVAAPAGLGPLAVLMVAFESVEPMLAANRPFSQPRQEVIARTPALHERELAKIASLTASLAAALEGRGVAAPLAPLAAQTGMTIFSHAVGAWLSDATLDLGTHLARTWEDVQALAAESSTRAG